MNLSNIILGLYPCYLSLEAIKNPRNEEMKHILIMWILWFTLSQIDMGVTYFLFWLPFISIFEPLKLVILILSTRPDIANNFRSLLIAPIWNKIKRRVPAYWHKLIQFSESIFPRLQTYRLQIVDQITKAKNILAVHPPGDPGGPNVTDLSNQRHNPYIDSYIQPTAPEPNISPPRITIKLVEPPKAPSG